MSTMSWIAVHEEVLGGKLRGLRKAIGSSESEALGILTLIWLWARKNAGISGLLLNVEREDITRFIAPAISTSLDAEKVTDALIELGWIDEEQDGLYIHEWSEWQKYWYKHLEKKEKDRNRKRHERGQETIDVATSNPPSLPPPTLDNKEKSDEDKTAKKKRKKKSEPEKIAYAENVRMQQTEYDTLVDRYGTAFTQKLIETLDNYKGSSGKSYKSDYRAILNWVVERCEQKYSHLIARNQNTTLSENPFEQYK